MTQTEVASALRQEAGLSLSQAYLSQIEGGKRVHLSNKSRDALARFFRVHPGYLVNDPPEYPTESGQPAHAPLHPHASPASRAYHGIPGFALVPGLPGMPSYRAASHAPETPVERTETKTTEAHDWSAWTSWTSWPGAQHAIGHTGSSASLENLLSRLRDHPDAERVLLVMEQALTLSREQLDALTRELARLRQRDGNAHIP